MNQKNPFIFTADKETADKLLELGFHLVSKDEPGYTFLNETSKQEILATFSHGHVSYTNKLCI